MNVVGNAIKFTPNGEVSILVYWIPDEDSETKIVYLRDKNLNWMVSQSIFYINEFFGMSSSDFGINEELSP